MTGEDMHNDAQEDGRATWKGLSSRAIGPFSLRAVTILVAAIVLTTIIIVVVTSVEAPPRRPPAGPPLVHGSACPALLRASEQLDLGSAAGFTDAVRDAAREALSTLDRSGAVFGRPERLAIELAAIVEDPIQLDDVAIQRRMDSIRRSCSALGRWGA